jgi:hypothetical protein
MFDLNYKGVVYSVSFDYTSVNADESVDNKKLKTTRCFVTWVEKPMYPMLSIAEVAICSPKDNFCKATGRKIALTKVMKNFNDKEFRTAIWNKYFSLTKKK